ncbi:MAG: efflux RND transporter periplasmic adaptor subunit [Pseudomonadales bacterium]|nr:efflux RND transporter periplasmic adaptor subunit [Pseudomonadales bacterium]
MAKKLLPLAIIIVSVVVAVGLVKSRSPAEEAESVVSSVLVDVITALPQDTHITVASQGTVEPHTQTSLVSEVAGKVIQVSPNFVTGGFFRKGETLLQLDDLNYRAAVSQNEAAVAAAKSTLEQEKGQADVAQREWDRMTPERQAQVRAKELYLRKPQLQEALARLEAAEADLEQSLNDLRKTTLIAPYDGMIREKNANVGQFVSTGTTLAQIFAVDYAEIRLPIPEDKIQFLDLPSAFTGASGPEVKLISRLGDQEQVWNGRMTRTEGTLDTRTRVLFSVVQINDPYGLSSKGPVEPLRIGTYVNASIQGKLLKNVTVLPRHTLQADNKVWVADAENRLRSRSVDLVTVNGDSIYIAGGLETGDRVVVTRLENPLNSMLVETNNLPYQLIE